MEFGRYDTVHVYATADDAIRACTDYSKDFAVGFYGMIYGARCDRVEIHGFPEDRTRAWDYITRELLSRLNPGGQLVIHG